MRGRHRLCQKSIAALWYFLLAVRCRTGCSSPSSCSLVIIVIIILMIIIVVIIIYYLKLYLLTLSVAYRAKKAISVFSVKNCDAVSITGACSPPPTPPFFFFCV